MSLRASGEGASIELNASALTRAGGASSPEGRGKIYSALIASQISGTSTRMALIRAVASAPVARLDAALK